MQKSCDHAPEGAELAGDRRKPRAKQHRKQRTRRGQRHGDKKALCQHRARHHRKHIFGVLAERGKARHAQHAADKRAIEPHTKRRRCQQIYMPDEPRERHVHKRGRRAVHQDKVRDRTAGMAQKRPVVSRFSASEIHARKKQPQKNHAQQPQKYHVVLCAPPELRDKLHAQSLADARDAKADEARSKADVV